MDNLIAESIVRENESLDAENTRLLYLIRGARNALYKALIRCPPDSNKQHVNDYICEVIDELNEELAKHENHAVK